MEASWTFPSEEVPPLPDAADMERRVKREEILHTGKLRLKIVKAGAGICRDGFGMLILDHVFFWRDPEHAHPLSGAQRRYPWPYGLSTCKSEKHGAKSQKMSICRWAMPINRR